MLHVVGSRRSPGRGRRRAAAAPARDGSSAQRPGPPGRSRSRSTSRGSLPGGTPRSSVLIRSWPDARALRERLPDEAAVYCGPLRRLPVPERGYACRAAPDGADRLESAEEASVPRGRPSAISWHCSAEHGELILRAENRVGLDRLLGPGSSVPRGDDADWPSWARLRPPGSAPSTRWLELLGGDDLLVAWALHGPRSAPRLAAPWTRRSASIRRDPVVRATARARRTPLRTPDGGLQDPRHGRHRAGRRRPERCHGPGLAASRVRRGGTTPSRRRAWSCSTQRPGGDVVVPAGHRRQRARGGGVTSPGRRTHLRRGRAERTHSGRDARRPAGAVRRLGRRRVVRRVRARIG